MPDRLDKIKTEQAAAIAELKADFQKKKREAQQFFRLKRRAIRHELAEKLIEARRRREEKQLAKRQERQDFLAAVKVYYVSHYSAASQFRKKGIRTAEEVHNFMKERELARREKRVKLKPRGKLIDPEIESAIRRFHCCGGSKNNFYRVWARYRERGGSPTVRTSGGLSALLNSNRVFPIDGFFGVYNIDQALECAARPFRPRNSTIANMEQFPRASEEELSSGQWLTIKEFATVAGLTYAGVMGHSKKNLFFQRYHPLSGLLLVHAPTAAAYFLDLASKSSQK